MAGNEGCHLHFIPRKLFYSCRAITAWWWSIATGMIVMDLLWGFYMFHLGLVQTCAEIISHCWRLVKCIIKMIS
jgi:hypothetical protein